MKILVVITTFIFLIVAWAMTSTCDYNTTIQRKADQLNKDLKKDELGYADVTYAKDLNCESFEYRVSYTQMMDNLMIIQKIVQKEIENTIAGKTVTSTEEEYKEFIQLSEEEKLKQFKSAEDLLEIQNNIKKK